jgi:hypothetical protein
MLLLANSVERLVTNVIKNIIIALDVQVSIYKKEQG